jgi:hypothetical protein
MGMALNRSFREKGKTQTGPCLVTALAIASDPRGILGIIDLIDIPDNAVRRDRSYP